MTDLQNLPCCGTVPVTRLKELPHVFGCDFDLVSCEQCGRTWAGYWCEAGGGGGWELVSDADAEKMMSAEGDDLRQFMRGWAKEFE